MQGVIGRLDCIPAETGWEVWYTLDRSPVHNGPDADTDRADIHAHTHTHTKGQFGITS